MNNGKYISGRTRWHIAEYGNLPTKGFLAIKHGEQTVCIIPVKEILGLTPEIVDNARIIASVPELLAFVNAIALCVKSSDSTSGIADPEAVDAMIDHARKLSAKAKG